MPPTLPRSTTGRAGLALAIVALGVAFVIVGPVPQDLGYHNFADKRPWLGVPNFGDVMSNAGLTIVGLIGISVLVRGRHTPFRERWEAVAHWIFHVGVFITGFGSAYYHWNPNNATLVWDRLPMTLFFMPFFALTLGERLDMKLGRRLLIPLVIVGIGSVAWWHFTESAGRGDLRPYALVQFVPVILIPILLWRCKGIYTHRRELFTAVAWYAVAKLCEGLDRPIYTLNGFVSGHTLKHLAAAVASLYILLNLMRRREA
jgi:hypothetical protein